MSIIQAPDDVSDVLDSVELLGKGRPGIEDMIGEGEHLLMTATIEEAFKCVREHEHEGERARR